MFIGEKKIKGTLDNGDGTLTVGFKDNSPDIILKKEMFKSIKKKEKGEGNVTDAINHYFAVKFLYELAENGMEFYMIENISVAMRTLAHNMREDLIRKTFNCSGGDAISLKTLKEQYDEDIKD